MPSKLIFRRITPASLRAAYFGKVTREFNAGLLLANVEYHSATVLYNLSDRASRLQRNYKKTLEDLTFTASELIPNSNYYVGSELVINVQIFKGILNKKQNILINTGDHQSVDDLIRQHNNFANHLTLM